MPLPTFDYSGASYNGPLAAGAELALVTAANAQISYLDRSHIRVSRTDDRSVNADDLVLTTLVEGTDWAWNSAGTAVILLGAVGSAGGVIIRRDTPLNAGTYPVFMPGLLTSEQLNYHAKADLYIDQEILDGDVSAALILARNAVRRSGDTMQGPLILSRTVPLLAGEAASKAYVDTQFSGSPTGEFKIAYTVSDLPATPVNGDKFQILNTTGLELLPSITGLPAGFVGDAGYSAFIIRTGGLWQFLSALPQDADRRYIRKEELRYSKELYLSKSIYASDSNNGTSPNEPLLTFNGAHAKHTSDTQINVSPGTYVEATLPIRWKRDTGIKCKTLRGTTIRPAAGQEFSDIFKVDSGFYCWGLTFAGHQANELGQQSWAISFDDQADNTAIGAIGLGAYIQKSPYIQNCSSYTAEDDAGTAGSISRGSSGGGINVDGSKCAINSPIRSMVVDSYTQVNLGGPGCLVQNDGYAQLVSFFGTFCQYHVKCLNGGQVNLSGGGTSDFGQYGLVAEGFSPTRLYGARARVAAYGTQRKQIGVTIDTSADVFTTTQLDNNNQPVPTGFVAGDRVKFRADTGALPTGIQANTTYYVVSPTSTTWRVSEALGGTPVNMTGTATGAYTCTKQGDNAIDIVGLEANRIGQAVKFPRAGSLGYPGTPVSVLSVSGLTFTVTLTQSAQSHTYQGGGTVTVGGATYPVTSCVYNNTTGSTQITAQGYTPAVGNSVTLSGLSFICNSSSRPVAGQLMFPRLSYPSAGATTFSCTKTGENVITFTAPSAPLGPTHVYSTGGTAVINGIDHGVQGATYDKTTGVSTITTKLPVGGPIGGAGSVTVNGLEFICQENFYVVTGSTPIDVNGNAVNIPTNGDGRQLPMTGNHAGYRVTFFSSTQGGLAHPIAQNAAVEYRNRSQISAPGHTFEYVGSGMNYDALPWNGGQPNPANKIVTDVFGHGRVFSSNTDELGNFRVGEQFEVDGTTGAVTINTSIFNLSGLNYIGPFSRDGGFSTVGVQLREVTNLASMLSSLGSFDGNTVPTVYSVSEFLKTNYIPRHFASAESLRSVDLGAGSTINLALSNHFTVTMNGARTFLIANEPATDSAAFTLLLTMASAGAPTFPAGVRWASSTPPSWTVGKSYEIYATMVRYAAQVRWLLSANEYTLT